MIEHFKIIYPCLALIQCMIFINDLICRIRKKHRYSAVRNSLILTIIVFFATFVGEFAFFANFYESLSFRIIFGYAYIGSVVALYFICREKIIYNFETQEITAYKIFKKIKFDVYSITRIYSSDEFLDIYLGDKRIRYGNLFVTGENEFVQYVKTKIRQLNKN